MICSKCKVSSDIESLFCESCGNKLDPYIKVSPNNGKDFNIVQVKVITIGRAGDNAHVINNNKVSSYHCRITKDASGRMSVEDLNSANGTFINGKRIATSKLLRTDVLRLGTEVDFDMNLLTPDESPKPSIPEIVVKPEKSVIKIGRTGDNDIVLNNIKVSRNHARIVRLGTEWQIEDLKSSNGTFVNGKSINTAKITESDKVTIGGVPLDIKSLFEGDTHQDISGNLRISSKNLYLTVKDKEKGYKTIVDDITLPILPGEFVGLIGPSGAGKTTLMMMMTGTIKPSRGDVFINETSLFSNYDSFKGQIGYVPQEDIIHRELTVIESFGYTAKLRLENTSQVDIDQQVDNVITMLDLNGCRDTEIHKLSGGQKKRVNLGQELITEPSVLFLDEPTSGLDPKTDLDVMNLLKNISKKGKIVILTTHSITVDNFEILDNVVVLTKGGKLAYYGPANRATEYFSVNKPYEIFDELEKDLPDNWRDKYRKSEFFQKYIVSREKIKLNIEKQPETPKVDRSFGLGQFIILAERYLKIKIRDKASTLILFLQAPIIAVLLGLVYNNLDDRPQTLFILLVAAMWLGCSNAAREIIGEKSIYKRERMVNLKIPSYLFSKIVVLALLCALQCFILAVSAKVFSPPIDIEFQKLFVLLFSTSFASLMIGLFLSSVVPTTEAAMGLIPIVLIPQIILGGLIFHYRTMNEGIKFLSAFMVNRWSFEAALIGEYGSSPNDLIAKIGFESGNLSNDFMMLGVFCLVFYVLTTISLKRKDN